MNRRKFLSLSAGMSLGVTLPLLYRCRKSKQPNIILILMDDMGWKDAAFMGSRYYETPNIDKLSQQGMVFSQAYANAPNCAPSRASLLTGQYPPRHGIYTVDNPDRGEASLRKIIPVENITTLGREIVALAEVFKKAGYICASIGKWHLGDDPESGPLSQGFDINIGGNHLGHPKSYFSPYNNKNLEDGPAGENLTERLTHEAVRFIETAGDRSFFLYLPYFAVHTPLQAKAALIQKYTQKKTDGDQNHPVFAAMIETADDCVGKIMEKLDQQSLTDNTIIIFFSDNGGVRSITSMEPLRGGKGMLYEGGIREPLIICWPGHIRSNTTCDVPVMGCDLFPTLLEMTGLEKPDNHILDGLSIFPLLKGKKTISRDALFWHFPAYLEGKNIKGARDPYFRTRPCGAVRVDNWKLIQYFEDMNLELYHLKTDIGETKNLAHEMPQKAKELLHIMEDWRKKINAPVPTELNPLYNPKNTWGQK